MIELQHQRPTIGPKLRGRTEKRKNEQNEERRDRTTIPLEDSITPEVQVILKTFFDPTFIQILDRHFDLLRVQ
jgi:hypothetical protein